ncbi:MAG: hypothetical protein K2Y39_18160 [Candidatus Obscuribacterales bacterium]|nr:hypothetical protein [Candidatus Obscuribacterales bacterium]
MITRVILLLATLLTCSGTALAKSDNLEIKSAKTASGMEYTLFYQGPHTAAFELKRPKQSDNSVLLCIPCAFTSYVGSIDGIYICDGRVHHKHFVSNACGGAGVIRNGYIDLISTNKGKIFTADYLKDLSAKRASLFQQFLVVENGIPAHFKDKTLYQRRAIVKLKDGQTALVESKNALTLTQFGVDLKELGAKNALYTDMGAYDEGWYRDAVDKAVKPIGNDRSLTEKQTNWFTFRVKQAVSQGDKAKMSQ